MYNGNAVKDGKKIFHKVLVFENKKGFQDSPTGSALCDAAGLSPTSFRAVPVARDLRGGGRVRILSFSFWAVFRSVRKVEEQRRKKRQKIII